MKTSGNKISRINVVTDVMRLLLIDWAAGTGGYDKATVQDAMSGATEKRFGDKEDRNGLSSG